MSSYYKEKIPGVKYFFNISYALGLITSVLRYKQALSKISATALYSTKIRKS
jgi:hypothetical protein